MKKTSVLIVATAVVMSLSGAYAGNGHINHEKQQDTTTTRCDKPAVSNTDAALGAALLGVIATAYIKDNPQTKDYLAGAGLGGLAGYLVADHYNKNNCEQKENENGKHSR